MRIYSCRVVRLPAAVAFFMTAVGSAVADMEDARTLAPFLSSTTVAVVTVDLADASTVRWFNSAVKFSPNPNDYKPVTAASVAATLEQLRKLGAGRAFLVIDANGVVPEDWFFGLLRVTPQNAAAVRAALPSRAGTTVAEKDGVVYAGNIAHWGRLQRPGTTGGAAELLAVIEKSKPTFLSVVARLPDDQRRAIAELLPQLPMELGGGPTSALTEGLRVTELSATAGDDPTLSVIHYAKDAAAAKDLRGVLTQGLVSATSGTAFGMRIPVPVREMLAGLKPTVTENRLEWAIDGKSPAVRAGFDAIAVAAVANAGRIQVRNDLKQIGLAMHNYHDAYSSFPPGASVGQDGKPLLSWRVHILPFLEVNGLYQQFHMNEPWDSEHNRKLIAKMPDVYAAGGDPSTGKTPIFGLVGPGTIFPKPGEVVRIKDIKDGTSNTIMAAVAAPSQAIEWTKPDELSIIDPTLLAKLPPDVLIALFGDGAVHELPLTKKLPDLLRYFTIAGLERLPPNP